MLQPPANVCNRWTGSGLLLVSALQSWGLGTWRLIAGDKANFMGTEVFTSATDLRC
jgi:hypothetical protein